MYEAQFDVNYNGNFTIIFFKIIIYNIIILVN
jgi:hypothetical protein